MFGWTLYVLGFYTLLASLQPRPTQVYSCGYLGLLAAATPIATAVWFVHCWLKRRLIAEDMMEPELPVDVTRRLNDGTNEEEDDTIDPELHRTKKEILAAVSML